MEEAPSIAPAITPKRARDWALFVRRALAIGVGLVFIYAGATKIADPVRFASDIANYQILAWPFAIRLAFYLPWLELLCGLALVFNRLVAGALFLTLGLMTVFIGATISAKARGIDVTCGCFGSASNHFTFAWHLALDFVLLAILIELWFCRDRRGRSEPPQA
jgi:uncharacterized membrane protein YphA (DoxX/SURF4 family)